MLLIHILQPKIANIKQYLLVTLYLSQLEDQIQCGIRLHLLHYPTAMMDLTHLVLLFLTTTNIHAYNFQIMQPQTA